MTASQGQVAACSRASRVRCASGAASRVQSHFRNRFRVFRRKVWTLRKILRRVPDTQHQPQRWSEMMLVDSFSVLVLDLKPQYQLFLSKNEFIRDQQSVFAQLVSLGCAGSLVEVSGGCRYWGAWASRRSRWLLLWNTGTRAQVQQLWCLALVAASSWALPGAGIQPVSPVLAGGFLSGVPP